MNMIEKNLLREMAAKYIWWKTADQALLTPQRIVAQIMNIGDYFDVQTIAGILGDDYLIDVLLHAEIGQFNEKSWTYWHYRLNLAKSGEVPPLPQRKIA